MVVQVATRSPQRRPFLTPLWFVIERGVLYLTTGPATRAGRNVLQHPEVVLLFSGERSRRRTGLLRLKGRATCHRGLPSLRVLLRVAAKYYVPPGAVRGRGPGCRRGRCGGNAETPEGGVSAGDTRGNCPGDSAISGSFRQAGSSWYRRSSRPAAVAAFGASSVKASTNHEPIRAVGNSPSYRSARRHDPHRTARRVDDRTGGIPREEASHDIARVLPEHREVRLHRRQVRQDLCR